MAEDTEKENTVNPAETPGTVPADESSEIKSDVQERNADEDSAVKSSAADSAPDASSNGNPENERLRLENEAYRKHFFALNQEIEEIRRRYNSVPEPEVDPVQQLSNEVSELKNGFDELKNLIVNSPQNAPGNASQTMPGQPERQPQPNGNGINTIFQQPYNNAGYFQQPPMFQPYCAPMFQTSTIMPAPTLPYIPTPTIMPMNTQVPQLNNITSTMNGGK